MRQQQSLFSSDDRVILSVRDITAQIKGSLERTFSNVWITGEVSNVAMPLSGHVYLTLKDADAQIRGVLFRSVAQQVPFKLENGMKVLCFGSVTVYPPRGEYQVVITRIEPKGVGALQLAFEQLKKKLEAEGLFDEAHKKELPFLPRRIGVVTSLTGAAIRDIKHVIERRFNTVALIIVPVKVQGDGAKEEIAAAIDLLNEYSAVDVMIVGRGGGSLEDLWAFNEETVARAIFRSAIPVISAVGHEIDYTISDFVADMRAPTPSAAAELVVSRKDYLEEKIAVLRGALSQLMNAVLDRARRQFTQCVTSYFFKNPRALIEQYSITVDHLSEQLSARTKQRVSEQRLAFQGVCKSLDALSPLRVLARGYSVTTRPDGGIISSVKGIAAGDRITTRVTDGTFQATVTEIK